MKEVDNDHTQLLEVRVLNIIMRTIIIIIIIQDTAKPTRKQKTYVVTASKSNNIVEEWSVLEFEIPYYFGQGR